MSTTTQPDSDSPTHFHHRASNAAGQCQCPIHRERVQGPFTAPLGLSFASQVSVQEISREEALEIYREHHSYKQDLPNTNIAHHGLYYQDNLLGAITYRYPRFSSKYVYFTSNGQIATQAISERKLTNLPKGVRPAVAEKFPRPEDSNVAYKEKFSGDAFVTASRICVGVSMPNFASASLARSQEKFVEDYSDKFQNLQYLGTFVKSDFEGSMIKALRDKEWTLATLSEPSKPSNRVEQDINGDFKWVYLNPVGRIRKQSILNDFR